MGLESLLCRNYVMDEDESFVICKIIAVDVDSNHLLMRDYSRAHSVGQIRLRCAYLRNNLLAVVAGLSTILTS